MHEIKEAKRRIVQKIVATILNVKDWWVTTVVLVTLTSDIS